jgi:hypothetical protein
MTTARAREKFKEWMERFKEYGSVDDKRYG